MKTQLKEFQETAVRELLKRLRATRRGVSEDGELGAVVLSSPTGSGKTVTLIALLERLWQGSEDNDFSFAPDPQACFLWLSDSPALNEQSRDKFNGHSDVFNATCLEVIESSFDRETFAPGMVYFLNTQKLSKDALLTQRGENRTNTIWDTVANTAREFPDHFYLVIDEAHRGASARDGQTAQTLMQRFVLGEPGVGLPPIPMVIGMSATPERFKALLGKTSRIERPYEVPTADVVASGLLKETVVVAIPQGAQGNVDMTLLEEAVDDLARYKRDWARYCATQDESPVEPVLVVQVQDATKDKMSATPLDEVVSIIARRYSVATGSEPGADFFAHCFQDGSDLVLGGRNVRKIEPSRIQGADAVRVVFFKTALSTGWDCPRAEVMMSFRVAQDRTNIAQLVGRMVRTPLARRIERNEWLNTVRLYLPHYNAATVAEVVEKLRDPVEGAATEITLKSDEKTYQRAPNSEEVFTFLSSLPSYRIERAPKKANTARLRALARALVADKFYADAERDAKGLIVDELWNIWRSLDTDTKARARAYATFELQELNVAYGQWSAPSGGVARTLQMAPENINDLFQEQGRKLTNGLHLDFDAKFYQHPDFAGDRWGARLALVLLMGRADTTPRLEKVCGDQVSAWLQNFKAQISTLPEGKRKRYDAIRAQSAKPEEDVLHLPVEKMEGVRNEGDAAWRKHIFCDERGNFYAKFNGWETTVLEQELDDSNVVGFLRNVPRKPWAFCVPYTLGGEARACYPDFVFVRQENGALTCDILDPHDPGLPDAPGKAVGLAQFAEEHGYKADFGRIELIAEVSGQMKRLNLQDDQTRERVKKITSTGELLQL